MSGLAYTERAPNVRYEDWNEFESVSYTRRESLETVVCGVCGGFEFKVGQADYTTVIKCTGCGQEYLAHEG